MASSSSSSSTAPHVQHDVFLSFRGEDTRENFTSHLHKALHDKNIHAFIDDDLVRGDQISPALSHAIERSKISVAIFSEGYASSSWCLEELEKILECRSNSGQVVLSVFYRVNPSDIRNQNGAFGNGFAKVKERFNGEPEKVLKWGNALREAADLSGFDSNAFRTESILIEDIVKEILKILDDGSPLIDNKKPVGIDSRIEQIESLLYNPLCCKIGIWGIGGIGKTTLANAVFHKVSRHFESSSFIPNIREESEKNKGLNDLRRNFISEILKYKLPNLGSAFMRKRLGCMKVLIVFDDVTNLEQIESLVGDLNYFGLGSKIIITTRDKHVLENCEVDYIYETKVLSNHASFELFCQYAFRQNHHVPKDFMRLSSKVLTYVKGVPLALKVLGSSLFKRTKQDWESEIKRLKRIAPIDIQKVLQISYDRLNDEEQNIFLDIAFFFKGCNRDLIEDILDACGFNTHIGITVLIEKSLIIESSNIIKMHDLLQEMGKEIVRQESPLYPSKRSRLWYHKDICSALMKNMEIGAIRGICLHMSKVREIPLSLTAFSKMYNLRFLQVHGSSSKDDNKVHGFDLVESNFSELRYLFWSGYSAKSLPPNFHPKNLVALDMQFSKLENLLLGGQDLVNLKHINLRNSNNLLRILDLSQTPNLESLNLEGCTSLNLKCCISFSSLLHVTHWKFLQELILSNCLILKKVPFIPCSVKELYLDGTTIEELPSIERPSRLVGLRLENCSRLESLPEDICQLKSLEFLFLSGCSKLDKFPNNFGDLRALRCLKADGIAMREVPSSIMRLKNLEQLHLSGNNFESLPTCIKDLSNLEELHLYNCKRLQSLPTSIKALSNLIFLDVSNCKRLQSLPEFPYKLETMMADGCSSLEAISSLPKRCLSMRANDESFSFMNCLKLDFNALPEKTDALVRLQQSAEVRFWPKSKGKIPFRGLISYPGSEVPGWYSVESTGSLIKLPTGWLNDKLVGFALCVVLSPSDNQESQPVLAVKFHLYINGILISGHHYLWGWSFKNKLESDHVFLGYDYNIMKSDKLNTFNSNSEGFIQFYVGDDLDEGFIKYKRVKKCGVRLLYANDYLRTDANADERVKRGKMKDCRGTGDHVPASRIVQANE